MLQHPPAVRAAFAKAATSYLDTVSRVRPDQWDLPGALGEWTVRELTAHSLRAFSTIESYLSAAPAVDRVMAEAVDYFAFVLANPGLHAGVAQRGHEAGAALADPVGEAEATAARVLALVASTLDDEPVNTFAGQLPFSEYLATRVLELGVHTLDLQRATGQPVGVHPDTCAVVLDVLLQLADPNTIVLALTGRQALPDGFNVLA